MAFLFHVGLGGTNPKLGLIPLPSPYLSLEGVPYPQLPAVLLREAVSVGFEGKLL